MLTALREADGRQVQARYEYRIRAPFRCPACQSEVQLVKGACRVHHFRHRPEARTCRVARESIKHLEAKQAIWQSLRESARVSDVQLEHRVGDTNIADVFAVIDGAPVAIEIQRSAITTEEITARTLRYRDHGVYVLWLALLTEDHCFGEIAPSAWERWAHAAYGGRVYYWVKDDEVQPIHYGPHHQRIAERRWVSRDRIEEVVAAHTRIAKTTRVPEHGPRLSIVDDFTPRRRPEFDGGSVYVPSCSLFMDRRPIWWTPLQK